MNLGENREFSTAPMESGSFTVSSALSTPGCRKICSVPAGSETLRFPSQLRYRAPVINV